MPRIIEENPRLKACSVAIIITSHGLNEVKLPKPIVSLQLSRSMISVCSAMLVLCAMNITCMPLLVRVAM